MQARSRVLVGRRGSSQDVITYSSIRVKPNTFGNGRSQRRRASPFRRRADILELDTDEDIDGMIPEEYQELLGAVGRLKESISGLEQGKKYNRFCNMKLVSKHSTT